MYVFDCVCVCVCVYMCVCVCDVHTHTHTHAHTSADTHTVTTAMFVPSVSIVMSAVNKADADKVKHLIVTSGYNGAIKFFENRGMPVLC